MKVNSVSACIATNKVEETRDFYVKHFGARVTFDCCWYVNLQFGNDSSTLQFMSPQLPGQPLCNTAGLMYNFSVDDVDKEYKKLTGAGLAPVMPLEDHPWGDEGLRFKTQTASCCTSSRPVNPVLSLNSILGKKPNIAFERDAP